VVLFCHLTHRHLFSQCAKPLDLSAELMSFAAVPIVAVQLLKAGPGEIGLLASIQLLLALALLLVLLLLLLLGLIVTGNVSITALAVIGFMAAVGTVAFSVAAPSLVPAGLWAAGHHHQRVQGEDAQAPAGALAGLTVLSAARSSKGCLGQRPACRVGRGFGWP
jgi:hypothetical protein